MSKDHVAGLAIQIPEKFIAQAIQAEMLKNIPEPERWIEAIVRAAIETPGKDRYGHRSREKTAFGQAIEEMIQEEAQSIFRGWLVEHREQIRAALHRALTRGKAKRITAIANRLADGCANIYVSNVTLGLREDDE